MNNLPRVVLLLIATLTMSVADITGMVFKDFNANSIFDGNDEPGLGVPVSATCSDGFKYTTKTAGDGKILVSIPNGANVRCRLEIDPSVLGFASGSNVHGGTPVVSFVGANDSDVKITIDNPDSYCQENPEVALVVVPGYYNIGNGMVSPDNLATVFRVKLPADGTSHGDETAVANRTQLSTTASTGAIWGEAFKRDTKDLFVAASLRRHTPLKDQSTAQAAATSAGAIYKIDKFNQLSLFISIPDTVSATAANTLANRDMTNLDSNLRDNQMDPLIGRMGLSDIDINEEGSKLYAINLFKKELVVMDVANASILKSVKIPNPYPVNVCEDEMVRSFGLKQRLGKVYIGSVCENKIATGDVSNYKDHEGIGAIIQEYNGAIFRTIAKTNSLRYLRPSGWSPVTQTSFSSRISSNWSTAPGGTEPVLSDIEFNSRGDLILGYINRAAMSGKMDNVGGKRPWFGGDIRKMCLNVDGSFTDESSEVAITDCASTPQRYNQQGKNDETYYEFYTGEEYGGPGQHPETGTGALAQVLGHTGLIVGAIDANAGWQPGSVIILNNKTGVKIADQAVLLKSKVVDGGEKEPYGSKSGGMGDIEVLCDSAPFEIGDYIWEDTNKNGIQDPAEPAVANATVELFCENDKIGTTTTDANGKYIFGGRDALNLLPAKKLTPFKDCRIVLDKSALHKDGITIHAANNKDIDNNADLNANNDGEIAFKTSVWNNHSLDIGIMPAVGCVSGVIFQDDNNNGVKDPAEKVAANMKVISTDKLGNQKTTTSDAEGKFTLSDLLAGSVLTAISRTDANRPSGFSLPGNTDRVLAQVSEGEAPACSAINFPYKIETISVGNKVWIEDDNDGDATTGNISPVVGATIKLACGNDTFEATTDANGIYKIDVPSTIGVCIATVSNIPANLSPAKNAVALLDTNTDNKNHEHTGTDVIVDTTNITALDFGFIRKGSMCGSAYEDVKSNGATLSPIAAVSLSIYDAQGVLTKTTATDAAGAYCFNDLIPGDYTVVETQPNNYFDFSEKEGGDDSDKPNNNILNSIAGTVLPGETDSGNNFYEVKPGKICGNSIETRKIFEDNNTAHDQDVTRTLAGSTVYLLAEDGTEITSMQTAANNSYCFENLRPGKYHVSSTNQDTGFGLHWVKNGGDDNDQFKYYSRRYSVVVDSGEADMKNDFYWVKRAKICGTVLEDMNGDGIGTRPMAGVSIRLRYFHTLHALTDADGKYCFNDLTPGWDGLEVNAPFIIEEIQPAAYTSVSADAGGADDDRPDTGDINKIHADLVGGEADMRNDFVETRVGQICGNVKIDTNNDGLGDTDFTGITTIDLYDSENKLVRIITTSINGDYCFESLPAGEYTIKESQPKGYASVSEVEGGADADKPDDGIENSIQVALMSGEQDLGNNFVEVKTGSVCGAVAILKDGNATPFTAGVKLNLMKNGQIDNSTMTDSDGKYCFNDVIPGDYAVVEVQPVGYVSVSENEGGDDNDNADNGIENSIAATVLPGEKDEGNSFVEKLDKLPTYEIGNLFWVDANSDGVYQAGEQTIPNAVVELLDINGDVIASQITDASGKYLFLAPEGEYKVRFKIPVSFLEKDYSFSTINGELDNTNKVGTNGETVQSVKVGPDASASDLTMDAAVECPCADVSSDSAGISLFALIMMMAMTILFVSKKLRQRDGGDLF